MSRVTHAAGIQVKTATIASGASESNVIDLSNELLCNIVIPASLAGLTSLTIMHCPDLATGTFATLTTVNASATDYTITLTASKSIPLDIPITSGLGFIKIKGNTNTSAIFTAKLTTKDVA